MRGSPQPHQQLARQRLAPRLQKAAEGKGSSTATATFRQRNMLQFRLPVRPRMRSVTTSSEAEYHRVQGCRVGR